MTQTVSLELKALAKKAFPGYKGRTFRVETRGSIFLTPYWDGPTKSDYVAFNRTTGEFAPYKKSNIFRDGFANTGAHDIPASMIIIEKSFFCGKDCGIVIHLSKHDALA